MNPALSVLVVLHMMGVPEADDRASDALAAYQLTLRGELDEAEALYRSVIDRGQPTADLLYNLGTVQLERGRELDAIVSFERALRLDSGHRDTRRNLRVAREHLGIDRAPEASGTSGLDRIPFGPHGWALIVLLSNVLVAVGVYGRRATWGLVVAWTGAVSFILSATVLVAMAYATGQPRAVAMESRVLRGGPAERYPDLGRVVAGSRVRPSDAQTGWTQILTPDGREGWVPTTALTEL